MEAYLEYGDSSQNEAEVRDVIGEMMERTQSDRGMMGDLKDGSERRGFQTCRELSKSSTWL